MEAGTGTTAPRRWHADALTSRVLAADVEPWGVDCCGGARVRIERQPRAQVATRARRADSQRGAAGAALSEGWRRFIVAVALPSAAVATGGHPLVAEAADIRVEWRCRAAAIAGGWPVGAPECVRWLPQCMASPK